MTNTEVDLNDLVYRLKKRAEIRRQIPGRKSVEEGKPDRIADILEEAAQEIERLRENILVGSDIHEGDGGYSIGTQEAYDEFVKKRNYDIPVSDSTSEKNFRNK